MTGEVWSHDFRELERLSGYAEGPRLPRKQRGSQHPCCQVAGGPASKLNASTKPSLSPDVQELLGVALPLVTALEKVVFQPSHL